MKVYIWFYLLFFTIVVSRHIFMPENDETGILNPESSSQQHQIYEVEVDKHGSCQVELNRQKACIRNMQVLLAKVA